MGVAPLIEVEDVLFHDFPDQFSVMTYVAQFHNLFCKHLNGMVAPIFSSIKLNIYRI